VLVASAAYFFFLLASYYVLRPLREEAGIAGGVDNLPWLFTATLAAMLLINPVFSLLVSRTTRRRFIPLAYRFFILNMLAFWLALELLGPRADIWLGRVIFVWVSVFNLFVVSVFWGFMADLWSSEQGRRLFGLIGVGGTIGAIVGAAATANLAEVVGPARLLLLSALLLEIAVWLVIFLLRRAAPAAESRPATPLPADEQRDLRGALRAQLRDAARGIRLVLASRYLQVICLYLFLYTVTSTVFYFAQATIIANSVEDPASRTALFGWIDTFVNVLTLVIQLFFTGRIITRFGVGVTLCALPAVVGLGLGVLAVVPALSVLVVVQVVRRASNYALSRPAREVLYTVVTQEEKYKSKSFIDTFVYRGGDLLGAWGFRALSAALTGVAGIFLLTLPLSGAWILVGLWLGRAYRRSDPAPGPPDGEPARA
jgi:AAA family ATP:ADP antiporter